MAYRDNPVGQSQNTEVFLAILEDRPKIPPLHIIHKAGELFKPVQSIIRMLELGTGQGTTQNEVILCLLAATNLDSV